MQTHFSKDFDMRAMNYASSLLLFLNGDLTTQAEHDSAIDVVMDISKLRMAMRSLWGTQGDQTGESLSFYEKLQDEFADYLDAVNAEPKMKIVVDLNIQYMILAQTNSIKDKIELYEKYLSLYEAEEMYEKCEDVKRKLEALHANQ